MSYYFFSASFAFQTWRRSSAMQHYAKDYNNNRLPCRKIHFVIRELSLRITGHEDDKLSYRTLHASICIIIHKIHFHLVISIIETRANFPRKTYRDHFSFRERENRFPSGRKLNRCVCFKTAPDVQTFLTFTKYFSLGRRPVHLHLYLFIYLESFVF